MKQNTRHSSYGLMRGARSDAENDECIWLIKNCMQLGCTYQIKLLAFKAMQMRKFLILKVPVACDFDKGLRELVEAARGTIRREPL